MDCEKRGYVNFVDRITFFDDFQDTQGHKFRKLLQISCLGICCLFGTVSGLIFQIIGFILRVSLGLNMPKKYAKKMTQGTGQNEANPTFHIWMISKFYWCGSAYFFVLYIHFFDQNRLAFGLEAGPGPAGVGISGPGPESKKISGVFLCHRPG